MSKMGNSKKALRERIRLLDIIVEAQRTELDQANTTMQRLKREILAFLKEDTKTEPIPLLWPNLMHTAMVKRED